MRGRRFGHLQDSVLICPSDLPLTIPCLIVVWARLGCGEWESRVGSVLEVYSPYSAPILHGSRGGGVVGRRGGCETLPRAWGLISTRPLYRWACWCVVFHTDVPQQLEIVRREGGTSSINPGTSQNKTNDSSF